MPLIIAPDPTNLSLPKGKLLFKRRTTAGTDTGFRHCGNCDKFLTKATPEVIDNYSSMDHIAGLYAEIVKRITVEWEAEGFEFDPNMVSLGLAGDVNTYAQASGTATGVQFAAAAEVVLGAYYEIGVRNPVITDIKQGATALVLGTDYVVIDPNVGLIYLLPTGAAVAGTALTWDGTIPAILASVGDKLITIGTSPQIQGTLRFLPDPMHGPRLDVTLWNVFCTPNGPIDYISDNLAKVSLKGMAQLDSAGQFGGSSASPYGQVVVWQT